MPEESDLPLVLSFKEDELCDEGGSGCADFRYPVLAFCAVAGVWLGSAPSGPLGHQNFGITEIFQQEPFLLVISLQSSLKFPVKKKNYP